MGHEVLIEGVLPGDQDRQRFLSSSSCPTGLLAEGCEGAGKCDDDRCVESADVDAEFEGVGGNHPRQFATEEPLFDLSALGRRVTGPIGSNRRLLRPSGRRSTTARRPVRSTFGRG